MARSKKKTIKVCGVIVEDNGTRGRRELCVAGDDGDVFLLNSEDGLIDPLEWKDFHVEVLGNLTEKNRRKCIVVHDIRERKGYRGGGGPDSYFYDEEDEDPGTYFSKRGIS